MKIVCVKEYKSIGLTYGKIYNVITNSKWKDTDYYWVVNDKGFKDFYYYSAFVTLEEWRESKINELYD